MTNVDLGREFNLGGWVGGAAQGPLRHHTALCPLLGSGLTPRIMNVEKTVQRFQILACTAPRINYTAGRRVTMTTPRGLTRPFIQRRNKTEPPYKNLQYTSIYIWKIYNIQAYFLNIFFTSIISCKTRLQCFYYSPLTAQ